MSIDTPQAETTTANKTTSHKGRTRLGWDADTLAWLSKYALVFGGIVLAIIAALGLRWEDQVDERREIREEEYKRTAGKEIETAKAEASRANESAAKLMKETETLRLQVAEQQERAAKAQSQLEEIRERQKPRVLNHLEFVKALKGQPTGRASLWFLPDDPDGHIFASMIGLALSGAGWKASMPRAIERGATGGLMRHADPRILGFLPTLMRLGAQPFGVTILSRDFAVPQDLQNNDFPGGTIAKAMFAGGVPAMRGRDDELAEDEVKVVVGPKQP